MARINWNCVTTKDAGYVTALCCRLLPVWPYNGQKGRSGIFRPLRRFCFIQINNRSSSSFASLIFLKVNCLLFLILVQIKNMAIALNIFRLEIFKNGHDICIRPSEVYVFECLIGRKTHLWIFAYQLAVNQKFPCAALHCEGNVWLRLQENNPFCFWPFLNVTKILPWHIFAVFPL